MFTVTTRPHFSGFDQTVVVHNSSVTDWSIIHQPKPGGWSPDLFEVCRFDAQDNSEVIASYATFDEAWQAILNDAADIVWHQTVDLFDITTVKKVTA